MKLDWKKTRKRIERFLESQEQGEPDEPIYDPAHVGGVVVVTLAALGGLYWLFWTLLVYEGGIFLKIKALAQLLLGRKSLADLGYEGYPYAMGAFEGWIGNLVALVLMLALIAALHRLYADEATKHKR